MTFKAWFRAQFGRLPLPPGAHQKLLHDVQALRVKLAAAEFALKHSDTTNMAYQFAQYAWQLQDADKKEGS